MCAGSQGLGAVLRQSVQPPVLCFEQHSAMPNSTAHSRTVCERCGDRAGTAGTAWRRQLARSPGRSASLLCPQVVPALRQGLYDDMEVLERLWDHAIRRVRPVKAIRGPSCSDRALPHTVKCQAAMGPGVVLAASDRTPLSAMTVAN